MSSTSAARIRARAGTRAAARGSRRATSCGRWQVGSPQWLASFQVANVVHPRVARAEPAELVLEALGRRQLGGGSPREWPKPISGATPSAWAAVPSSASSSSRSQRMLHRVPRTRPGARACTPELREPRVGEHVGLLVGDADDQRAAAAGSDRAARRRPGATGAGRSGASGRLDGVGARLLGRGRCPRRRRAASSSTAGRSGSAPVFTSLCSAPGRDHDAVAGADVALLVADAQAPAAGGEEVELLGLRVVVGGRRAARPARSPRPGSGCATAASTRPAISRMVEPSSVVNASRSSMFPTCIVLQHGTRPRGGRSAKPLAPAVRPGRAPGRGVSSSGHRAAGRLAVHPLGRADQDPRDLRAHPSRGRFGAVRPPLRGVPGRRARSGGLDVRRCAAGTA